MSKTAVQPLSNDEIDRVLLWLEQNPEDDLAIGYQAALDMVGAAEVKCVQNAILSIPKVSYATYNKFLDVVYDLRDRLAREIFDSLPSPNT